ncbi:hypothetical protein SAMN05421548_1285 [Paraburkholderia lycopersici]|uniref:Zinc-binding dehydrogenase n=1 Tax=Paraburkholderia lycopersici TaxID=416944 RepID=A0A1G6YLG8_9BURK|nr:hypothetical protein SAMN05421548_1285 [Paraburkholderia lycopersici]
MPLPGEFDDGRATLIPDIFPTGYFGTRLAEVRAGNMAVYGAVTACRGLSNSFANGGFDSLGVLTQREPLTHMLEAYRAFDARQPGWIKLKLEP